MKEEDFFKHDITMTILILIFDSQRFDSQCSALMISEKSRHWVFPGFLEWGGAQFDAGAECLYAEVCVFLLCHNDDVATMRTGASSRRPSAMLNMCDQGSQLRNSESQGLLGSRINQ